MNNLSRKLYVDFIKKHCLTYKRVDGGEKMKQKKILFIGDSITEWGKREDPEQIGISYVRIIHDYLLTTYPEQGFDITNKGIGGNRITDLASRWQQDVIEQNPDYLSISIGINDVWRQLDRPEMEQVDIEKFEHLYKDLLTQVKEQTNAHIILMEPTVIEEQLQSKGNEILKKYVKVVNDMSKQFETTLVPTHQAFVKYLEQNNGYNLTTDGVHMNSAGNMLMATTWLKAVEDQLK